MGLKPNLGQAGDAPNYSINHHSRLVKESIGPSCQFLSLVHEYVSVKCLLKMPPTLWSLQSSDHC